MDEDLKELFGLTDEDIIENEDDSQSDVVDQADDNATDEGEQENQEEAEGEDTEEKLLEEDSSDGLANHQQSREKNHSYAEARKQAEAELRDEKQKTADLSKENKTLREALKRFGYEGTAEEIADMLIAKSTGKTIEEVSKERNDENAKIREAVEASPEVRQAKELIKTQAEELARQHFANINKVNPEISSMKDLIEKVPKEDTDAIMTLVKGGMHIDKAYMKIVGAPKKEATQKKADTKQHFKQVNGAGSQTADVTFSQEEYELAEQLTPGLTKEQYAKYLKSNGRK